jgi:hypothetical protein
MDSNGLLKRTYFADPTARRLIFRPEQYVYAAQEIDIAVSVQLPPNGCQPRRPRHLLCGRRVYAFAHISGELEMILSGFTSSAAIVLAYSPPSGATVPSAVAKCDEHTRWVRYPSRRSSLVTSAHCGTSKTTKCAASGAARNRLPQDPC